MSLYAEFSLALYRYHSAYRSWKVRETAMKELYGQTGQAYAGAAVALASAQRALDERRRIVDKLYARVEKEEKRVRADRAGG